jgi:hypothetical protein
MQFVWDFNVNTILEAVIAPGIWYGVRRLSAIRDHLARLNGSVLRLDAWKEAHDAASHELHEQCRAQFIELLRGQQRHGP